MGTPTAIPTSAVTPVVNAPIPKPSPGRQRSRPRQSTLDIDFRRLARPESVVPLAMLGIVFALITPLPSFMLDVLISTNITISVIVLLVSLYIHRPVDFSVFPTTLLMMTLFRLALNISSSRLILMNGNEGTSAAGDVIEAFGNFVVGGNYVIGVVIFLVLIAIQYVVINHGAVRISEVTARFTLDALPGKQMSIDSDLNSGLINETEARQRRKDLSAEAEFYGAMDGATRFTQRDAVASILITAINIIAGFLIGVFQHGMDFRQALQTYTVLTIGDGLVTVIPALMISVSGGFIVSRASADAQVGTIIRHQIFSAYEPLLMAGGVLVAMAAFPGLPKIPFILLGGGVSAMGWNLRKKARAAVDAVEPEKPKTPKENIESLLRVEPLAVEVGLGLVGFVEGGQNSPLLRRIATIRKQLASDLGYVLPAVRVTDNLSLKAREYAILLKGVEVARYEIPQNCELAIASGQVGEPISGVATKEPAFGLDAIWIPTPNSEAARKAGYTVVDAVSVLGTHLAELIRQHLYELFSRQDAKKLLDRVAAENPRLVEDLVPKLLLLSTVQKVIQNLLRERVSIRDAVTLLEAISEAAAITKNPVLLTEFARQAMRRMVVKPFLNVNQELPAYFLDPSLEQRIEPAVEHGEHTSHLNLSPQVIHDVVERIGRKTGRCETSTVLLSGAASRYFVRQITEGTLRNLHVISHSEIPAGVRVVSLGMVS